MARLKIIPPHAERVYKVCSAQAWRDALACGVYEGSSDDLRDGYIHLSTPGQVAGVLARHFKGQSNLVAIAFETRALRSALKWEASSRGEAFPHFYGPLAAATALAVDAVPDEDDARAGFASQLT